jgi:hypothetical protein
MVGEGGEANEEEATATGKTGVEYAVVSVGRVNAMGLGWKSCGSECASTRCAAVESNMFGSEKKRVVQDKGGLG